MAAVAVPLALNQASASARNHPSYKEMIVEAIGSLMEKNGSTESSITAYISCNYNNLPPTHSAQLSLHLKDLKKQGLVETVHSYKLASGENTSNSASKKRGRPKKNPSQKPITTPLSERRKRGRPHKVASSGPTLILPQHMKAFIKADKRASAESGDKRIRAPPKRYINESSGKRKLGRPKKSFSLMVVSGEKKKRGRPSLREKKGPGRPKKSSLLLSGAAESSAFASPVTASGEKRKRGRPSIGSSARVSGKPRGRPPKIEGNGERAIKKVTSAMKEASSSIKRRGRPVKVKKRGRPAKTKSIASIGNGDVGETVAVTVDLNANVGDGEELETFEGNGETDTDQNTNSGRIGGEGGTEL